MDDELHQRLMRVERLAKAELRVAELEPEYRTLKGNWNEYGAEWGDRYSECAGEMSAAQQELEEARSVFRAE